MIKARLELLGHAPIDVPGQHDLGTDLLVAIRDERLFEVGMVGAQAKSGSYWFSEPQVSADGSVDGWWFYEASATHFEDWVSHPLPHLVILNNPADDTTYWVHVTPERLVRTGKGCKVLVPRNQTLGPEQRDELVAVATKKEALAYEHTALGATASKVLPESRLRFAILVPRLIAPHPNSGSRGPIQPEEALAILTLGRFNQFHQIAPNPSR